MKLEVPCDPQTRKPCLLSPGDICYLQQRYLLSPGEKNVFWDGMACNIHTAEEFKKIFRTDVKIGN